MDELASNVLITLKKSSVSAETKLTQLNSLKSSIKHQRVPESAQAPTIECIRLAISSRTSSSLVTAGFSALGHLTKRLSLQDQLNSPLLSRANIIPVLLERLGDSKEAYRTAALQSFCDLWPAKQQEVEKAIREGALGGNNAKAKLAGMRWVAKMHAEQGTQFRAFVPPMVACLEDADGTVRETAKNTLVELFRDARDNAKADLKKQLIAYNVRKSIASYIFSQLQINGPSNSTSDLTRRPETPHQDISTSEPTIPEPSLPPSAEVAHIEPLEVYSSRELEDIFRQMHPCFEDKEKEDNWKTRDNNILKIRRLLRGNAPNDYSAIFSNGIKNLTDGILKVVHSLRTTMSTNGCQLVQELARTQGTLLDPLAEIFLSGLEKMCSSTKQINSQNGNTTIDVLLWHISYNVRHLQHILQACGDKNVQPRLYACGWLQTVLKRQVTSKSHFEHTGGVEVVDKCIRKGLNDANPKVRESMRGTYWLFSRTWPEKAESIISTLDTKSRSLLEKDASNPNATNERSAFTSSVGPEASSNPRAATSNARTTLKETIAAQKKATLAAKRVPDRPNSAMSSFTPVRQAPHSSSRGMSHQNNLHSRGPSGSSSSQQRPTNQSTSTTSTGSGSLMSAPMRRPKKPEVPRPATADPYARRKLKDETPPNSSPAVSPRVAPKSSRSNIGSSHVKSKSTTTIQGGSPRSQPSSKVASPKASPSKSARKPNRSIENGAVRDLASSHQTFSPSRGDDNFTMVFPQNKAPPYHGLAGVNGTNSRPTSSHSPIPEALDEDNFTMVLPTKSNVDPNQHQSQMLPESHGESLSITNTKEESRSVNNLQVYEDHSAEETSVKQDPDSPKMILEEVPASEQNLQQPLDVMEDVQTTFSEDQERAASPPKKLLSTNITETPPQDRAEILKTRRLLSSGIERVKARTLDAHGFRRLQDLVKNNTSSTEFRFAPLLSALIDYLQAPNDALKTTPSKASGQKSQALNTIRAVIALYCNDDEVRSLIPLTLRGIIESIKTSQDQAISNQPSLELDKAADEILKKTSHDQLEACAVEICALIEQHESSLNNQQATLETEAKASRRVLTMALQVLSKLLPLISNAASINAHTGQFKNTFDPALLKQFSSILVVALKDVDPDVRRRGTEFALELYTVYPISSTSDHDGQDEVAADDAKRDNKTAFWKTLRQAGDGQVNLVAYYLARRNRAATA